MSARAEPQTERYDIYVGCSLYLVLVAYRTAFSLLVVDSHKVTISITNDSVAIKTGAVAMGVGISGYTVRFADSDGVRIQEGTNRVRLRGSIAIYRGLSSQSHVAVGRARGFVSSFEYLERRIRRIWLRDTL